MKTIEEIISEVSVEATNELTCENFGVDHIRPYLERISTEQEEITRKEMTEKACKLALEWFGGQQVKFYLEDFRKELESK